MHSKPLISALTLGLCFAGSSAQAADDLSWISGSWCSQQEDAMVEERWLPATTNRLLAVNRTLKNGETLAFEFLQIDLSRTPPVYLAQPGGREATPFVLTALRGQGATFSNPDHDFPQTIRYERSGPSLTATIAGPSDEGEVSYAVRFEPCAER